MNENARSAKVQVSLHIRVAWPQGYKTFYMLNSAEYEICPANKSQITNK